jgi:mannose-6-phosphate isomerase-like protein (cupin superfamily)
MTAVMDIIQRNATTPFITKDGSEIRELMAYRNSGIRNLSLAEAILPAGATTQEHYHADTDEIYYILEGRGRMRIEGEERAVGPLDAIAIPANQRHNITNTGDGPLVFLCCCAPAYEHDRTVMTG